MFIDYLIESFLPWSLKMDYKNSISLLKKEKEKFMCDMYNHFALNFRDLPTYELHMFRVVLSKINILECDVISITIPENTKFHSLHIVYNDNGYNYFVINKGKDKLDLINHNDKKICGAVAFDLSNLNMLITSYIAAK